MVERLTPTGPTALHHRIRGPIAGRFLDAHALSPADVMPFTLASAGEARAFDRLRRAGIIREARPGHFWYDLAAHYARAERRRRTIVPLLVVVAVMLAFVATRFYRG